MLSKDKHGPWALIAGGSEGVGSAFARQVAAAGINLILVARKPEPLEVTAREVGSQVQVRKLQLDLMRDDVVDRLREASDDVDVGLLVFNAAAGGGIKPFIDRPLEENMQAVQLSVIAQTKIVYHFAPKMAKRGRGGIILMGSLAGNAGTPNLATYSAAKAYTQMLAESLWGELRPHGVDVLAMILGATDTPNRTRSGAADVPGMEVLRPDYVVKHAFEKLGEGPTEVPPPLTQMFQQMGALSRRQIADMMSNMVPVPTKK